MILTWLLKNDTTETEVVHYTLPIERGGNSMAPTPKLNNSDLLDAAIEVIREFAYENLNARNLAGKLNISTKPIFRLYKNMNELKAAVYERAEMIYTEYLFNEQDVTLSPFLQVGLNYIKFAYNEKNLFKFIFLTNNIQSFDSIADMADMPEIINYIASGYGLSAEKAKVLFSSMWSMTHGISCIIATNDYHMNESEIISMLQLANQGVLSELKTEEL